VKVPPTPDETFSQTLKGFGTMVERVTPWLLDLGSWIFGALIAFDLLIMAALLTVGPADLAALIAAAAFALALPPSVAGFFLLRLLEDIKKARLEDVAIEALQEVGLSVNQVQTPKESESIVKQRTKIALIYSYSILSVSVLLTVIGVSAALWHMAWWISVSFVVVTLVSPGVVVGAMASWPSRVKPPSKA
jgi:hypothetical protein